MVILLSSPHPSAGVTITGFMMSFNAALILIGMFIGWGDYNEEITQTQTQDSSTTTTQGNNAQDNHNQQNSRPSTLHEDSVIQSTSNESNVVLSTMERAGYISNNYSFRTIEEITRWSIIRSLPPVKSFLDDENIMDCPICMEVFKKGELIQPFKVCNHEFHVSCLFSWLHREGKTTCPVYRKDLFF
jgi:hypothetical protein